MKRPVSSAVVIFYWVALPFCALSSAGLLVMLATGSWTVPSFKTNVLIWFAMATTATVMTIWRLRVHERARRLSDERMAPAAAARTEDD
jgi:hypothetical protein